MAMICQRIYQINKHLESTRKKRFSAFEKIKKILTGFFRIGRYHGIMFLFVAWNGRMAIHTMIAL